MDCVKELIQAGADLNAVDMLENTPLRTADKYFSFDCVSTLFKAGAEIDTTNLAFMAMITLFVQTPNSEGTVRNAHYKNVVRMITIAVSNTSCNPVKMFFRIVQSCLLSNRKMGKKSVTQKIMKANLLFRDAF